jgi:hypothetical protein
MMALTNVWMPGFWTVELVSAGAVAATVGAVAAVVAVVVTVSGEALVVVEVVEVREIAGVEAGVGAAATGLLAGTEPPDKELVPVLLRD